jgi:protein-S-isoprenylcysteine O-methyltransferase Ste14
LGATAIEFRLRMAISAVIVALGLWSPWLDSRMVGAHISLLEWSALQMSRTSLLSFSLATPLLITVAASLAGVGALLRVWATAYLGSRPVQGGSMRAAGVMADGPYRYVRNPLYLGLGLMIAGLAFVMPPSGAVFAVALISVFLFRLILGEEAFLCAQLGEPYRAYLASVPRLIPRLRSNLAHHAGRPQWLRAFLAELLPIGVFLTLAALSWSYDNRLMDRAILIVFGVSLVVRALLPSQTVSNA